MSAYSYTPYSNSMYGMTYPQQTTYPQYQSQYQQQPQATYQVQQPSNGFITILVDCEQDMDAVPVAAGCEVMFISFKEGKFWIKSTDKSGRPNIPIAYDFHRSAGVTTQNQNGSIYVTKEEFESISNKLNEVIEKLGGDK